MFRVPPRRVRRLVTGVAAFVALVTGMSMVPGSAAVAGTPAKRALGQDLRVAPGSPSPNAGWAASEYCFGCAPPLTYHGGKVMGTATIPGRAIVTAIYWAPTGRSYAAGFTNVVSGFLKNVAAASGATNNVFAVPTEYRGPGAKLRYSIGFGGAITDPTPYPSSGCPRSLGYTACLTDAQLQREITRVITARKLPVDPAHLYSVFLPAKVDTCASQGVCASNTFCGYHGSYTLSGKSVLYSNEPYPDLIGCNTHQSPNGNAWADTAIKTESHEVIEAITDPFGTAWWDATGNEIGDECNQFFGTPLGSTNPAHASTTRYNQVIGTGKYYVQTEFSNRAFSASPLRGCVL